MKIGLIGAGRLGICFSLLCEQAGYDVLVSDIREEYVAALQSKKITTNEPQVPLLLETSQNFEATTDNFRVIQECDIIYTLVATPSLESGDYDVSAVWKVVNDVIASGVKDKALIVGCTTNPGDCAKFQEELDACGWKVFYNPEFIAQGSIVKDLRHADMVLIGGDEEEFETLNELRKLYKKIQTTEPKFGVMSATAAEVVKLAMNCYLTTKISYANMVGEVMTLAGLGSEINTVLKAIGDDTRVGNKFLKYGYGFGGPCLPRDNRAFAAFAKSVGLEYNLGETTDNFNRQHATFLLEQVIADNSDGYPFYFPYVSYKKGTDMLVESQQYKLCLDLLDAGYTVYIDDIDDIIKQIETNLTAKYGGRALFGKPSQTVYQINI
jgi:nucleotide sugar dehydrogenase|tara:strand:+ start:1875 stop:3017 length:1143 start_codon:yes stop_codon:yes gene_type:complete